MSFNTQELLLPFITHKGFTGVGANIVKHLSAKDLVACMQVCPEMEVFIMESFEMCLVFFRKAILECSLDVENCDMFDILFEDLLEDPRRIKLAAMMLKLQVQFEGQTCPMDLSLAYPLDDMTFALFKNELEKVLKYCNDEELQKLFLHLHYSCRSHFITEYIFSAQKRLKDCQCHETKRKRFIDMMWTILSSLKNKTYLDGSTHTTPLHYLAASKELSSFLETWIQQLPKGWLRSPVNENGLTPLHVAIMMNNDEGLKILCQHLSLNQLALRTTKNSFWSQSMPLIIGGERPIHIAAKGGNPQCLKLLCQFLKAEQIGMKNSFGQTPLHLMIHHHFDAEGCKMLLEKMSKDHIGAQDDGGRTALHYAVLQSNMEAIKILCKHMSQDQIGIVDHAGKTALKYAVDQQICKLNPEEALRQFG